jgi:transposase-like protein
MVLGQGGEEEYRGRKCYVTHLLTIGVSMDEDKNPECPECQGEMLPAMGEVRKGEVRRIEQNWKCDACKRVVTLPFT